MPGGDRHVASLLAMTRRSVDEAEIFTVQQLTKVPEQKAKVDKHLKR
jgi:hypothetical protein